VRRYLVGFVIGGMAMCGAVFFVDLSDPWMYFWMYAGTVARMVLATVPAAAQPLTSRRLSVRPTRLVRDSYGWTGVQGRR